MCFYIFSLMKATKSNCAQHSLFWFVSCMNYFKSLTEYSVISKIRAIRDPAAKRKGTALKEPIYIHLQMEDPKNCILASAKSSLSNATGALVLCSMTPVVRICWHACHALDAQTAFSHHTCDYINSTNTYLNKVTKYHKISLKINNLI